MFLLTILFILKERKCTIGLSKTKYARESANFLFKKRRICNVRLSKKKNNISLPNRERDTVCEREGKCWKLLTEVGQHNA